MTERRPHDWSWWQQPAAGEPPPPPPPPPDQWAGWGPVQIGPREVYDAVMMLRETVWQQVSRSAAVGEDLADHETRLRNLEDVRPAPRINSMEARLQAVESRLFPLPVVAALLGVASLALTIITNIGGA